MRCPVVTGSGFKEITEKKLGLTEASVRLIQTSSGNTIQSKSVQNRLCKRALILHFIIFSKAEQSYQSTRLTRLYKQISHYVFFNEELVSVYGEESRFGGERFLERSNLTRFGGCGIFEKERCFWRGTYSWRETYFWRGT